jgi:hypothetical protein
MTDRVNQQSAAAHSAAKARQAIADRIGALLPNVKDEADASVILQLAQAYAALASEPPRVRS